MICQHDKSGQQNCNNHDDLARLLAYILSTLGVLLRDIKCYTVEGGLLR